MVPMISIIGKSGSGKTTLLEKLIPELKKKGYKIGTVKHTHHDVDVDKKGKDSARHKAAGATAVILAAKNRISIVKDVENDSLDSLAEYLHDMDIIITEGFKNEKTPKIEVYRKESGKTPIYGKNYDIVAMVTNADNMDIDIPIFKLEDVEKIANFIEMEYIKSPEKIN